MRSCSIISEFREEVPSSAIGPDRMLCIPMRNVLACALATQGAASRPAALPASILRRVMARLILHLPGTGCDHRLSFSAGSLDRRECFDQAQTVWSRGDRPEP